FPPSAIGQCQAVIALGQREVRNEPQRQLEFGQRVVEASPKQINIAQGEVAQGSSLSTRIAASAARSAIGRVVAVSAQPLWALNVWVAAGLQAPDHTGR